MPCTPLLRSRKRADCGRDQRTNFGCIPPALSLRPGPFLESDEFNCVRFLSGATEAVRLFHVERRFEIYLLHDLVFVSVVSESDVETSGNQGINIVVSIVHMIKQFGLEVSSLFANQLGQRKQFAESDGIFQPTTLALSATFRASFGNKFKDRRKPQEVSRFNTSLGFGT